MGANVQVRIPENVDFDILDVKINNGELKYNDVMMKRCLEFSQAHGLCDTNTLIAVILWNVYRGMRLNGEDRRGDFENFMKENYPDIADESIIKYHDLPGPAGAQ